MTQISYLAQTKWGTVQVAAFIRTATGVVQIIEAPVVDSTGNALITTTAVCGDRNIFNLDTPTLTSSPDTIIRGFVSFYKPKYTITSVEKVSVEKFPSSTIVFVLIFANENKYYRTLILFSAKKSLYYEIEAPVLVFISKPKVIQQQIKLDGTTTIATNNVQQIAAVDPSFNSFWSNLSEQIVEVKTSKVVSIVSDTNTHTNKYTVIVETQNG